MVDIVFLSCFEAVFVHRWSITGACNQDRNCPTKAKLTLTQTPKLVVTTAENGEAVDVDILQCYYIVVVIVVSEK